MALIANRRSVMTLFSDPTCPHSHRVRLVLAEKSINVDIVSVEGPDLPPELLRGIADQGLGLRRPGYGVSDSQLDPYFGGIHALAFERGSWTGAADPRRDGRVGFAWRQDE